MSEDVKKLERLVRDLSERGRVLAQAKAELASGTAMSNSELQTDTKSIEASSLTQIPKGRHYGVPSEKSVDKIDRQLLEQEQLGLFTSVPLVPGNEFPTLMARLPLFLPIKREGQKKLLDKDNALPFETPFGRGRRFGALTTVEDEDVLIAIIRSRSRRLTGKAEQLPIRVRSWFEPDSPGKKIDVHSSVFTLTQLLDELGLSHAGPNYDGALDSLKRINSLVIELEVTKHERYFGKAGKRANGRGIKLVEILWDVYDKEGVIYCQLDPIVAMWLEKEYTYLNWNIRKQLSGSRARAIHRYLSSQPANYSDRLLKIAEVVGIKVVPKKLRPIFKEALDQLVALGWLESYEITGTGRSAPMMLKIVRSAVK